MSTPHECAWGSSCSLFLLNCPDFVLALCVPTGPFCFGYVCFVHTLFPLCFLLFRLALFFIRACSLSLTYSRSSCSLDSKCDSHAKRSSENCSSSARNEQETCSKCRLRMVGPVGFEPTASRALACMVPSRVSYHARQRPQAS